MVGNLTTDLVLHGLTSLPDWGYEVECTDHAMLPAGQAGYLAAGLARLGIGVRIAGVVGADARGHAIRAELESAQVDVQAVETSRGLPTAITAAFVRSDGERAFASDFACQRELDEEFLKRHLNLVETSRAVCMVGLFNLPALRPGHVGQLFSAAQDRGVLTVLDTGWDPNGWMPDTVQATRALLKQTDVFLPNTHEAMALTGIRDDPAAAARELTQGGASVVVVKCGATGSVGHADGKTETVAALPARVHDAIGAGDCYDAAFLHAYLHNLSLRECMVFANAAATIYVSRSSDRQPSLSDIEAVVAGAAAGVSTTREREKSGAE